MVEDELWEKLIDLLFFDLGERIIKFFLFIFKIIDFFYIFILVVRDRFIK